METLSKKITFRQYEEGDLPAILHLWSEESGWGGITVEQFNTWFVNTPYGNSLIVVAENEEGKVIGQIVYAPTRMHVNGREIRSLRGAAPILSREMRGENIRDFNHPAFAMIRAGFEIAQKAGYQFVYSFPAFGWLGLFKSFPKTMPNPSEATSFECFLISLSNEKEWVKPDGDCRVSLQTVFGEEYDALWKEAVEQLPIHCAIVRKAKWLQWAIGGMYVLEVRSSSDHHLVGYAALKKESGLVVDVFAGTVRDIERVYLECVSALHHSNPERLPLPFTAIKGMISTQNKPVLEKIGYARDNFQFAFGGYLLDTSLSFEDMQMSKWQLSLLG
jgi:hypothetical protein